MTTLFENTCVSCIDRLLTFARASEDYRNVLEKPGPIDDSSIQAVADNIRAQTQSMVKMGCISQLVKDVTDEQFPRKVDELVADDLRENIEESDEQLIKEIVTFCLDSNDRRGLNFVHL